MATKKLQHCQRNAKRSNRGVVHYSSSIFYQYSSSSNSLFFLYFVTTHNELFVEVNSVDIFRWWGSDCWLDLGWLVVRVTPPGGRHANRTTSATQWRSSEPRQSQHSTRCYGKLVVITKVNYANNVTKSRLTACLVTDLVAYLLAGWLHASHRIHCSVNVPTAETEQLISIPPQSSSITLSTLCNPTAVPNRHSLLQALLWSMV